MRLIRFAIPDLSQVEAGAVQFSVHTLVLNAYMDALCSQQCSLHLRAVDNQHPGLLPEHSAFE